MKGEKKHEDRLRPRLRECVLRRYPGWHRDRAPLRFASACRGSGRTVADPTPSSTDTETACAGARLLCADGRFRVCSNGSRWSRARLWVPVRGNARCAHLDLGQGHWHRPYQQCHAHLGAQCATQELEGARQPVGAVPYCWYLGGGRGVCVLLNGHGTQVDRSLTFEKAASIHEVNVSLLRLLLKGRTQA